MARLCDHKADMETLLGINMDVGKVGVAVMD
jgi:hypothetical protein